MSDFGQRIKELRKKFDLTQQVLADEIGVNNKQTISDVEKGKQKTLNDAQIRIILDKYGVSKGWLILGEGEMFQQRASVSQNTVGNWNNQVHGSGNAINGIPPSAKECTVEMPDESDMVDIPFLHDVFASAGGGAVMPGEIDNSVIKFSASFLKDFLRIDRFNGIHLISATGNSMEPTIIPGELLMVNPYENEDYRTKDGAIYVIICSDSVFVKRVYRNPITKEMKLISDNKDVDDIVIQGDDLDGCKIVGRVVGHFDKL